MTPILYSFRRCPYAMRARLALDVAQIETALREVVLRDKPQDFLDASPSATVPCLVAPQITLDESLDIMIWALTQNDPERWLAHLEAAMPWIARMDGPFKTALDRTKYAARYPDEDPETHRAAALSILRDLDAHLDPWLLGAPGLADFAILPFVRQFAFIDKPWFDSQPLPRVHVWLERFLTSARFERIMTKYPQWHPGDPVTPFPVLDRAGPDVAGPTV